MGPTQLPSIKWGCGVSVLLKWLGSEVDHLIPTSIERRNVWSYTSTPPVPLWQVCGQLYLCINGFNNNVAYNF